MSQHFFLIITEVHIFHARGDKTENFGGCWKPPTNFSSPPRFRDSEGKGSEMSGRHRYYCCDDDAPNAEDRALALVPGTRGSCLLGASSPLLCLREKLTVLKKIFVDECSF